MITARVESVICFSWILIKLACAFSKEEDPALLNFYEQCKNLTRNDKIEDVVEPIVNDYYSCGRRDIDLAAVMTNFDSAVLGDNEDAINSMLDENCHRFLQHFECIDKFYKNISMCYEQEYSTKMLAQNQYFISMLHYICDNDGKNMFKLWKNGVFKCEKSKRDVMYECLDKKPYTNPTENVQRPIRFEIMKVGSYSTCSISSQKPCIVEAMKDCLKADAVSMVEEIIEMFKVFTDVGCDQQLWFNGNHIKSEL